MYEENYVLRKIEVELKDKTLTLQKERRREIGFAAEVK